MKALVTGAGRGIGAATAKLFAKNSIDLVLVSRTLSELEAVRDEILELFPKTKVQIFKVDVSQEEEVLSLFSQIGDLDCLINNAGYISVNSLENISLEEWNKHLQINLTSAFLCSREAFKKMKTGACIINISSLGGIQGSKKFPGFSAYSAAKAGLVAFTECLAVEGKRRGIRVNLVAPGTVDTKMLQAALPGAKTSTKPEHIAKEILYFLSDVEGKMQTGMIKELFNA